MAAPRCLEGDARRNIKQVGRMSGTLQKLKTRRTTSLSRSMLPSDTRRQCVECRRYLVQLFRLARYFCKIRTVIFKFHYFTVFGTVDQCLFPPRFRTCFRPLTFNFFERKPCKTLRQVTKRLTFKHLTQCLPSIGEWFVCCLTFH